MGRLGRFFGDRPVAPCCCAGRTRLDAVTDFDAMQMRSDLSPDRVREQHDALSDAYRAAGVVVHYVEQGRIDKPNAMFVRDLMLMTPGAIVTRPASTVRAGEERLVAEALASSAYRS